MKKANVLIAGIIGTSCMTLFSYFVSKNKKKNFKEPELLGKMVHRISSEIPVDYSQVGGWVLHFATGLTFAAVYKELLRSTKVQPTLALGTIAGGISGLLAILIWESTFQLHPNPPKIHFNKYYGHLLVTHIVFGATTFLTFQMVNAATYSESNSQ